MNAIRFLGIHNSDFKQNMTEICKYDKMKIQFQKFGSILHSYYAAHLCSVTNITEILLTVT